MTMRKRHACKYFSYLYILIALPIQQGWIEPLLQRIKDKPSNIVIPQIDGISDRNLEFNGHPGGVSISVGGFTWYGTLCKIH